MVCIFQKRFKSTVFNSYSKSLVVSIGHLVVIHCKTALKKQN